jgi:hypothetical protein
MTTIEITSYSRNQKRSTEPMRQETVTETGRHVHLRNRDLHFCFVSLPDDTYGHINDNHIRTVVDDVLSSGRNIRSRKVDSGDFYQKLARQVTKKLDSELCATPSGQRHTFDGGPTLSHF